MPSTQAASWPRRAVVAKGEMRATMPRVPPLLPISATIPPSRVVKTMILALSGSVSDEMTKWSMVRAKAVSGFQS